MAEKKLLQLLDSISIDKNTNLLPTTLKDGVTCLGVEGDVAPLSMTEDATATASDMAAGVTAYINNEKVTGTVNTVTDGVVGGLSNEIRNDDVLNALVVETKAAEDVLIRTNAALQTNVEYSKLAEEIGLTADKVVEGNTVLGVVGTGTTGVDTSDATATAEFIANGKTAYVNDEKVTGTADHYVTSDDTIILASAAVTENVMGLDCVTYTTPIQNGLCSTPTMFISGEKDFRLALPVDRIASAIELTADKVVKGNTVLGIEGIAELEEGTKIYASLTDLQAVTGTEGQFAIVNSGETFDGAYKYTNGAWVEMFSSRRYDNTLTPEEYEQAVATATDIQGGGNV